MRLLVVACSRQVELTSNSEKVLRKAARVYILRFLATLLTKIVGSDDSRWTSISLNALGCKSNHFCACVSFPFDYCLFLYATQAKNRLLSYPRNALAWECLGTTVFKDRQFPKITINVAICINNTLRPNH